MLEIPWLWILTHILIDFLCLALYTGHLLLKITFISRIWTFIKIWNLFISHWDGWILFPLYLQNELEWNLIDFFQIWWNSKHKKTMSLLGFKFHRSKVKVITWPNISKNLALEPQLHWSVSGRDYWQWTCVKHFWKFEVQRSSVKFTTWPNMGKNTILIYPKSLTASPWCLSLLRYYIQTL